MQIILRSLYAALSLLQFVFLFIAFEQSALAYVDPGSGILLVQILSSGFGGAVFFLRRRLLRYLLLTRKTPPIDKSERSGGIRP